MVCLMVTPGIGTAQNPADRIRTNRRFRQPRKTYTYDNQNHPAPKNKPLLPITRTAGPGTPDSRMQRHPGK